MKILVADDSKTQRSILISILKSLGHEAIAVSNGAEAWKKFAEERFEVVFTDWEMPELDGLQLTNQIRREPFGASVFIIMLSAIYVLKENLYQAVNSGVNDFLKKPYTKRDIFVRLRLAEAHRSAQFKIQELKRERDYFKEQYENLRDPHKKAFRSIRDSKKARDR